MSFGTLSKSSFKEFLKTPSAAAVGDFFTAVLACPTSGHHIVIGGENTYMSIEETLYDVVKRCVPIPRGCLGPLVLRMVAPTRHLLWECMLTEYDVWRRLLELATDDQISELAIGARESNTRLAAIRFAEERGLRGKTVEAIAKMLPEFWKMNSNANLLEDIFEVIEVLQPDTRYSLHEFIFSEKYNSVLGIALYMAFCTLVEKSLTQLSRLRGYLRSISPPLSGWLRLEYDGLLEDNALGWKYCTGQMPSREDPDYQVLMCERRQKLERFQQAYCFDSASGSAANPHPQRYSGHLIAASGILSEVGINETGDLVVRVVKICSRQQAEFEKDLIDLWILLERLRPPVKVIFRSGGHLRIPEWFRIACERHEIKVRITDERDDTSYQRSEKRLAEDGVPPPLHAERCDPL